VKQLQCVGGGWYWVLCVDWSPWWQCSNWIDWCTNAVTQTSARNIQLEHVRAALQHTDSAWTGRHLPSHLATLHYAQASCYQFNGASYNQCDRRLAASWTFTWLLCAEARSHDIVARRGWRSISWYRLIDIIPIEILSDREKISKWDLFDVRQCDYYLCGHSYSLEVKRSQINIRSNFVSQRTVEHWKSLLEHVVSASSVNWFKNHLDSCVEWGV